MLQNQKLVFENDEAGTVHLFNTYNVKEEAEIAEELARSGSETVKIGGGIELRPMGYIPQDMWLYDPWLIEANKARRGGDMGEFTRLVQKFFDLHPSFQPPISKKYF